MKASIMLMLFVCLCLKNSTAQQETTINYSPQGIQFDSTSNWKTILAKAKAANKFLFVDGYATWCAPCKRMDKEVFTEQKVSEILNTQFFTIKLQMDSSEKDDLFVRSRYHDASNFRKEYQVNSVPTSFIFSADGILLKRYSGFQSAAALVSFCKDAMLPKYRQYYDFLEHHNKMPQDYSNIRFLVKNAKDLGDQKLSEHLALDYIEHLDHGSMEEVDVDSVLMFIKENLGVMANSASTSGILFRFFQERGERYDNVTGMKGTAKLIIPWIIKVQILAPILNEAEQQGIEPDWKKIEDDLTKKYTISLIAPVIFNAKVAWYTKKKDWQYLSQAHLENFRNNGADTSSFLKRAFLNNLFWEVFVIHCEDKNQLNEACGWIKVLLVDDLSKRDPEKLPSGELITAYNLLDTYANILYKAGQNKEAIIWQERAIQWNEVAEKRGIAHVDTSYTKHKDEMNQGVQIWKEYKNE